MDDLNDTYLEMWAARQENEEVGDGWGNFWPKRCPRCGALCMEVVRAGQAVCTACEWQLHGQGARKEL